MEKPVKIKKVLKLSELDKRVLLEYSGMRHETEMKVAAEAAIRKEIHKL